MASSSEQGNVESARDDIDRELLAKATNRDADAFRALYIHYYRTLARFLSKFTRDRSDIEEIINDALLIVWKNAGAFRSESRVSTWIIGIAYRCALKAFRRTERHRRFKRLPVVECEAVADEASHMNANQQMLKRALQKLPLEQRLVIELTYTLDRSCAEIAEIVGCSVNTVKSRMFHARRKLRVILQAENGVDGDAVIACGATC